MGDAATGAFTSSIRMIDEAQAVLAYLEDTHEKGTGK